MKYISIILCISTCFIVNVVQSEDTKIVHDQLDSLTTLHVPYCMMEKLKKDTPSKHKKQKLQRWLFFPIIGWEEETSLILGALGIHFFPKKDTLTSRANIEFKTEISMRKQVHIEIMPEWYRNQDKEYLYGTFIARFWPSLFYQIGQDSPGISQSFDHKLFLGWVGYQRIFIKHLSLGGEYRFQWYKNTFEGTGPFTQSSVCGRNGGLISGLGLMFTYDTRNNRNWPTKGSYALVKPYFNYSFFGSGFDFVSGELNLRKFIAFGKKGSESVVAMAAHAKLVRGAIPYLELSKVDGAMLLRGINSIRYRDRDLLAGQIEFRTPFWQIGWFGPFGLTTFFEAGQVAHTLTDVRKGLFVYSIGSGFRYGVIPEERINLRVDFSYVDNGFGFVLEFEEAF